MKELIFHLYLEIFAHLFLKAFKEGIINKRMEANRRPTCSENNEIFGRNKEIMYEKGF